MFRAIRFASKLHDFKIDDNAKDSIKRNCKRCEILSRERITSEIEKMFSYEDPKCGLLLLNELCLWDYAFPNNEFNEIYVNCISKSENILLRWFFASMNYKGDFISFIHDMKLSNELAKSLNAIKYTFDNFKDTSFPSLYKVRTSLYKSGKLAFNALNAVFTYIKETTCIPDDIILEWYEFTVSGFYENLEFIDYHLPCNGKEISEYSSIPEGKELGEFINTIKEEIFHGHIKNTRLSVLEMSKHAKMLKIIGK
jgi:tRNA nucleotidyltransferase/poly(A) polymerase